MLQIISRREAIAAGLKRYFTGVPCKRGHISERGVACHGCYECQKIHAKKWMDNGGREKRHAWNHSERGKACFREYDFRSGRLPRPTRPMPEACELCKRRRKLQLDHDHKTKKFRGWLCRPCNTAIGILGDNRQGLLEAVAYVGD